MVLLWSHFFCRLDVSFVIGPALGIQLYYQMMIRVSNHLLSRGHYSTHFGNNQAANLWDVCEIFFHTGIVYSALFFGVGDIMTFDSG